MNNADAPSKEEHLYTYLLIYRGNIGDNSVGLPELLADIKSFESDKAFKRAKELIGSDMTPNKGIDVYQAEVFSNEMSYMGLGSIKKPGSDIEKAYVISEGKNRNGVKIDLEFYVDKMGKELAISEDVYIVPVVKIKTVRAETQDLQPDQLSKRLKIHSSYDSKILYQRRQMPGYN